MGNLLMVNEALTEWLMVVAKSVLPRVQIPPTSSIGGIMQMLGVDLRTYNLYDELGFLMKPTIKHYLEPMVNKFFEGKSDAEIKELAMSYIEAFRDQARERGHVNLFGVHLGEDAFNGLHDIMMNKLR